MPYAILKFSDTVEECQTYGLAGRSYVMDERDAAWLEQWNQLARGEGTSSGSTRRSKLKASENEDEPLPVIEEDWFELCMGLFEKYSLEHYPFLHLVSTRIFFKTSPGPNPTCRTTLYHHFPVLSHY